MNYVTLLFILLGVQGLILCAVIAYLYDYVESLLYELRVCHRYIKMYEDSMNIAGMDKVTKDEQRINN